MKLKSIIYFISTILFASCSSKYEKIDNQWSWVSKSEGGKQVKKMMVDDASFSILADAKYAKDKNKVFYQGSEIKNADPSTFKVISKEAYAKDENHVYLENSIVLSANPVTFKVLEWPYGKDETSVFCGNIPMNVSAVNEFKVTKSTEHKSYYSTSNFIRMNKDYAWLYTIPNHGIIVGEESEGETISEKFKGFKKL